MAHYFLLLDGTEFHEELQPALSASWRSHSFAPCRGLCARLQPRLRDFTSRYCLGNSESLLTQVGGGVPFDRTLWRHLAGEVLWYAALEIPEIQTAEEPLRCLLAPEVATAHGVDRLAMPPILQAHRGSRDLLFGGRFYRPDQAGWNDTDDVDRLATYLGSVDPSRWRPEQLVGLPDLAEEERVEELADARAWLPALVALYDQAREHGRVIVCESW
jgi:hypothetical protein